MFQKENIQIIHSNMEIYKYVLLFFAGYIAVCAMFSKIGLPLPICFDSIFGSRIAFVMKYVVFFGFVWWAGREIYNRYINKKEGWMSMEEIFGNADPEVDVAELPKDLMDIPDVPCNKNDSKLSPEEKKKRDALRKATGETDMGANGEMCKGELGDIPDGYYGITIKTKDESQGGKTVNELKMRPLSSVKSDCKIKKSPDGKVASDRAIVPLSSGGDASKCKTIYNLLKSEKGVKQYDANNLDSYNALKEKTSSEKEDLQRKFDVDVKRVNPPPVYYEPGTYTFGTTGYVPDYERSVYLSKTTNLSQVDDVTFDAPYLEGGFCTQYANSPQNMEQKCRSLDNQTCATTSCCVLLGGQKCVSGDSQGPKIRNNYSDTQIINRDYYYYQGKCFGNCDPNSSNRSRSTPASSPMPEWGNKSGAAYAISAGEYITGSSPSGKVKSSTPARKPHN